MTCVVTQVSLSESFLRNIGITWVTTQTVALKCFLQHWYGLCYNTNICFEMFLSTLVLLVLQHKQLVWIISCNIDKTCVTTQTVGLNCFLQHWYDLCYNTNSRSELFFASLIWLVLQHKQLVWIISCNIGMICVTTQTVAYELFHATIGTSWFVLQHKPVAMLNCFIATLVLACVTTQAIPMLFWNVSKQHCYGLL